MGIVSLNRHDLANLPVLAEHHAGFSGVEIHGTALLALLAQGLVKTVKRIEVRQQRLVASAHLVLQVLPCLGLRRLHHVRHFIVGEAGMGIDNRLIEFK